MIYTTEQQEKAAEGQKAFDAKAINNIGSVKVTGGQKAGYVVCSILSFGILPITQNIGQVNYLNQLQMKINEAASNIDVQLEKRFDTLTKIVDAVQSHTKFNKEVYENISKFRSGINESGDINAKQEAISKIQGGINLAFENYPSLGADDSVQRLITESSMIEKEIAASRRLFNSQVTEFNSIINTWPTSVVAAKKGYTHLNLFVAEETKRKDVSVKF